MGKLFGTDGVRGIANKDLTPTLTFQLARACGYILSKKKNTEEPYFIIGKDTRISSDMLESAIIAGLCSVGVSSVKMGIIPTPVVSFLTSRTNACGGVMISASHNPYPDNGIKFFNFNGFKLEDKEEEEIETLIEGSDKLPCPTGKGLGKILKDDILELYISSIKKIFGEAHRKVLKGFKLVVDCANGSAFRIAPNVLKDLGAEVIELSVDPDGININEKCGSTHTDSLRNAVIQEKADLGFAFDGDADRVIPVDSYGNIVDGDQMMCIIASYLKSTGRLKNNLVISTVMSNLGFEFALKERDISFLRTKVGDRYVVEEMLKKGSIIGGEQSGHIILLDYNNTGDGLITALMVLKVILHSGKSLSQLASIVTKYPQILINIPVSSKDSFLRDNYLQEFIKREEQFLSDRGRILVRPSGTEPLVRVMVEAMEEVQMKEIAEKIAREIRVRVG